MDIEQTIAAGALPEPAVAQAQRPKAKRRAISVAIPKAGLVLLAALTMIVFEGAFRKWVPPFQGGIGKYLMYFSKDIIFATVIFFPARRAPSAALKTFQAWLLPGCALLTTGALISCIHGLNPVGALLTTRATIILPVIAMLAVPRLVGLPLRRIALLLALWTVLNFALGVEQNRLPPDNILNRYSEADQQIVAVESGVRATGTFSYITGMSIISSVGIWAGLVLMGLAKNLWQRAGAWATLAAGFGCGLVSISRAPIIVAAAMAAGWLILSRKNVSVFTRSLFAGVFCLVVATGIGVTPVFSDLTHGLVQRSEEAGDTVNQRAFGQLGELVNATLAAPLGNGYGTQQVAGQYYDTGQMGLNGFESPLPRLVMETGGMGLIGYLLVCAGALLALERSKREARSTGARAALLATQLLLLPFFYGNVIFDHTASAFVWMIFVAVMAGVMGRKNEMQNAETLKTGTGYRKTRKPRIEEAPHSVTRAKAENQKAES